MSPIDAMAVRRHFGRAARHYADAAALQHEVEDRLLESLVYATRQPAVVLDVGSGPGRGSAALKKRWPRAEVIALDAALPMLVAARANRAWLRPFRRVAGDANRLPLRDASVDLVWSSLCLQWCPDLPRVLDGFRRVLRPQGLLLFTTFGPDTLRELRAAWAAAGIAPPVHHFPDLPVIGDALLAAGFENPVVDIDVITQHHAEVGGLLGSLKAIGATYADRDRARGLGGRARFAAMRAAYERERSAAGLPVTWEIITAMAFAPDPGKPRRRDDGAAIAAIGVDQLRGSRIRRAP